ncbi:MAG: hypothetical protein IJR84_02560 [Bacteroidaceae bacterium]|nr:hypothetical protein [Bacteroidaceae bacterium]MBR1668845.1 hypothetical protein [Bacteroidaceae bacterium]
MTAIQLRAELFREINPILDNEGMMLKLLKYVKKLTAKKEDPTLMTKEEFFARVDEAREQIKRGNSTRFSDREKMNEWLNSL